MTRRDRTSRAKKEANRITRALDAALGRDRFPIDVAEVATEISRQRFPDDAVTLVRGGDLGQFEGGLYRAPDGKRGWGIIYNRSLHSAGRINFTLAHELGHYVLHRLRFPDGFECSQVDVVGADHLLREVELEANVFAATLLMPFDDFRRRIDANARPAFDDLGACADYYGTSLTATALRWLEYTKRRAVLVLSRDGFILWSRSSRRALRSGKFFRTVGCPPIPIPADSLVNAPRHVNRGASLHHECGVWFDESCEEIALLSDRYDFGISLLHLDSAIVVEDEPDDEDSELDFFRE